MKQFLVTLALAFLFLTAINAQDNIIKTNPLGLAFGNLNATYEKVLNEKSSVLGSLNFTYRIFGVDVTALGIGGAYRYYFSHARKQVPAGLYINPQVSVNFGSVDDFNYNAFSIGAEVGYQWVWESGVVLDLGIGPNYITLSGNDVDSIDFDNDGGVFPSATIAIGYNF